MVCDGIVLADLSPTPARASPSRACRSLFRHHQQKVSDLLEQRIGGRQKHLALVRNQTRSLRCARTARHAVCASLAASAGA
jgi:hypothetical protein